LVVLAPGDTLVVVFRRVCPYALLRSLENLLPLLEQLLQLTKVSIRALDDPLIPGASQAFTLQLLTQALTFATVVRTSLALQLQLLRESFLREALEFSLKLQARVLPHELFDPILCLQSFPALTLELGDSNSGKVEQLVH
jgi:hypothetical protein